ncbi:hypothetical protein BD769DRAFT_1629191 [Suillus cothurnatus]|nr:hypothetical protein BD769DRAFT_1629191 [Suillus cothurnatus]
MSTEAHPLPPPSDEQAYMYVSALEAGYLRVSLNLMAADQSDDLIKFLSLAFLLRHSKSNKQVVSDLGIHGNIKEYAPTAIQVVVFGTGRVPPSSVDLVVLSHLHWDHLGDPSPFATADFLDPSYFHSHKAFSSIRPPEDRLRFVTISDLHVAIGPYPRAMNFFGDGSMYIVDTSDANCVPCRCKTGAVTCAHQYQEVAEESIRRMRWLLEILRVQVLVAHDTVWYEENNGVMPG